MGKIAILFALCAGSALAAPIVVPFGENLHYTLRPLANGAVRVTCGGYDEPEESLLERYGLIDALPVATDAALEGRTLKFRRIELTVGEKGGLALAKDGVVLMRTAAAFAPATAPTLHRNAGFTFAAALQPGEHIVGGGDGQRERIALNGAAGQLWIGNGACHVPQPFYMSSKGWGVLFNTTRRLAWDVDKSAKGEARFSVKKQMLDCWLFTGSFYSVIDAYTQMSGRPHLPPEKSFGIWLIPFYGSDVNAIQFLAAGMRERRIPCDNISLEPGWMEKDYDQSVSRDWSRMRFLGCDAAMWRGPARALTRTMHDMGYNLGLWFNCQWDFTYEEERRVARGASESPAGERLSPRAEGSLAFVDERIGWQTRQDKITDPEKPYFDHMRKFVVDDDIDYFKLDGCCIQSEFPDRLYGNGKTDEEMHNLAFQLEAKQTFGDFEAAVTNKRAFGIYPCGTVGVQRYAGTWSGDAGGGIGPMIGILNAALCGHSLSTCDTDNNTLDGLHMGLLLPWSLVDSWYTTMYPGFMHKELDDRFRDYANLRMSLIPYLYSLCREATRTGKPIARPLCLEWPDLDAVYAIGDQFLLGESLMVSVYRTDGRLFLPKGRWCDFWTGRVYEGADDYVSVPVPANRGGHLMLREGALIPTIAPALCVTPGRLDAVEWIVFPSERETSFELYMDDGVTREYQKGAFAVQRVTQKNGKLSFGPVKGESRFLDGVKHTTKGVKFVYATWNIGHYAWGNDWKSKVLPEDGERRAADYRSFLNRIGADVIGVCEYAEDFTTNGSLKASAAVFGGYPWSSVGPSRAYQWNAQFWKGFKALERKTVDYVERHQQVYYQATRLEIGGVDVWIVQTHLDWTTFKKGFEHYRERQMQKLIDDFRDKPRVIISGDFNVGDRGADGVRREKTIPAPEEYDVFVRAGYALANSNGTPTCPSDKPTQPLDNIIVKGLDISNVRFHPAGDLSDHDAVSCTLTLRAATGVE